MVLLYCTSDPETHWFWLAALRYGVPAEDLFDHSQRFSPLARERAYVSSRPREVLAVSTGICENSVETSLLYLVSPVPRFWWFLISLEWRFKAVLCA
jgi:hypothetical protein